MKKFSIILMLLVSTLASGQRGQKQGNKQIAAEDLAQLHTKKMTLALVLTQSQAEQVYKLELAAITKRRALKNQQRVITANELSNNEIHLNRDNELLDAKIAFQRAMKDVLTEDQFKTWHRHQQKVKKKNKMRKKHHRG